MKALLYSQNSEEAAVLSLLLQQAGFSVRPVRDLERTIEEWNEVPIDFALITLGEDPTNSTRLVKALRTSLPIPLIVIVETQKEDTQVNLYESGADLVVTRPYSVRILLAQIRNLMRRSANIPFFSLPLLSQGRFTLDPTRRTVQVEGDAPRHLTQLEFRLLYALMNHAGQVIPAETLVEHVWGYSGSGNRDLVRGLVQRLRSKVEPDVGKPRYILTEAGIGYYFNRFNDEG